MSERCACNREERRKKQGKVARKMPTKSSPRFFRTLIQTILGNVECLLHPYHLYHDIIQIR